MKVEIYSDVACPWCYIGDRRFERALQALPGGEELEVVYRSFQLDPAAPETPVPMNEHLKHKFGGRIDEIQAHVAGAAAAEGLTMDFSRGIVVNTLTAHRLLRLAEHEYGVEVQRALADRLFEAYFAEGANVADPELLTGLATAVGMDEARVRAYLRSGEGEAETRAEIARAAEIGVRAVPTFVFDGRYAVEGAQPTSTFLRVLEQLRAEAATGTEGGADAACADGSCAV